MPTLTRPDRGYRRSSRVAITSATGKEIYVLDSVPGNHPYVRLLLVGEIAEALTNQHFPVTAFSRDDQNLGKILIASSFGAVWRSLLRSGV